MWTQYTDSQLALILLHYQPPLQLLIPMDLLIHIQQTRRSQFVNSPIRNLTVYLLNSQWQHYWVNIYLHISSNRWQSHVQHMLYPRRLNQIHYLHRIVHLQLTYVVECILFSPSRQYTVVHTPQCEHQLTHYLTPILTNVLHCSIPQ